MLSSGIIQHHTTVPAWWTAIWHSCHLMAAMLTRWLPSHSPPHCWRPCSSSKPHVMTHIKTPARGRQDSSDRGESMNDARVEGTSIKPRSQCIHRCMLTVRWHRPMAAMYSDVVTEHVDLYGSVHMHCVVVHRRTQIELAACCDGGRQQHNTIYIVPIDNNRVSSPAKDRRSANCANQPTRW